MIKKPEKKEIRSRIHKRIRRKLSGTAARPRLAVFRSVSHIYAQVIDDVAGATVVSASTVDNLDKAGKHDEAGKHEEAGKHGDKHDKGDKAAKSDKGGKTKGGNVAAAKAIGKLVAERAKEKGIKSVVFDRGGYLYHGRVKALADAARAAGLEF